MPPITPLCAQQQESKKPPPEPVNAAPGGCRPYVSLLLFALAALALLTAGALYRQDAYLTRGIPDGLPQPINYSGAEPGLNVYLDDLPDAELQDTLARIRALGVRVVKQPFYFSEDGAYDWAAADRLVEAVQANELSLVPLLDGDPARQFAPPVDPATFAAWAAEFARRYGDQIRFYMIWDEPNLASHWGGLPANANEYGALLSAAAAAIRAMDDDAVIIAAPLAPTEELGPDNLNEASYLQELYEAGAADAFDIVAGKPYGFSNSPEDRQVDRQHLNFSRIILLREIMEAYGDGQKALWAGNWGWNSLPPEWQGEPSIWGQVDAPEQAAWTVEALERARREWSWMGLMFLENWQPNTGATDPRWGFSIAGRPAEQALGNYLGAINPAVAYPGFHLASPNDQAQQFAGGWRFSPQYGADISEPEAGQPPDKVTFTFWGTDAGLRVRRADFRARLYVTVDDEPANGLPRDENGAALVLTSPDPAQDFVATVTVAHGLAPGVHTMEVVASRGWDQWALNGFSVAYAPLAATSRWVILGLLGVAAMLAALGLWHAWRSDWSAPNRRLHTAFDGLSDAAQLALTALAALIVGLAGWMTWGEQLAGLYRRLGDGGQLAITAVAASVFYITPFFFLYILALAVLFALIYLRPAWGLALVAFTFPFYVPQLTKPILSYRFSPVEVFMLLTFAAFSLRWLVAWARHRQGIIEQVMGGASRHRADYAVLAFTIVATLSLLFTERLDVASNEWRLVILEPALFYLVFRALNPTDKELWIILDSFVLGGVVVALIGLWQYLTGQNLITAEGGLMRLRSIYGSPNNVALYLGRQLPLLVAMLLLGQAVEPRRRQAYILAILPIGLGLLLTFSRGGLLLGVPAGLLVVFWIWQSSHGRRTWPWALAIGLLALAVLFAAQQMPQLAGRLNLSGATGVFRINLWRASLEMMREHPLFGVGLDNFLYAYRGRYILDAAWQEPNLNHPHNIFLDFGTRLGILGLLAGAWMIGVLARTLWRDVRHSSVIWLPAAAGFSGALAAMLVHGLVDHSFFLVDLAFSFYLMMGTAVWLDNLFNAPKIAEQSS
ncbi:MAG: O-antigen ligase family protein, partial [Candidatus Promineifilaceae bacterium]